MSRSDVSLKAPDTLRAAPRAAVVDARPSPRLGQGPPIRSVARRRPVAGLVAGPATIAGGIVIGAIAVGILRGLRPAGPFSIEDLGTRLQAFTTIFLGVFIEALRCPSFSSASSRPPPFTCSSPPLGCSDTVRAGLSRPR